MRFVSFFYAAAVGWAAMFLLFLLAQDEFGFGLAGALALSLLGAVPGLGNLLGAYAAVKVLGWSPLVAALLFVVSVVVIAGGAEWLARRASMPDISIRRSEEVS